MGVSAARLPKLLSLLVFLSSLAVAQISPRILITKPVDESQLTVLKGNTHPLARAEFDQGAAPADLPMNRMLLVLKRSAEQETALRSLLDNQQDKASPNYHKWLTPEEFGKQFGPADQDVQQVTAWLQSHGFQIANVSKGRTVIEFSGTAAQVQEALHTSIHKYAVRGEQHWANASDPQIPTALTPVVAGVFTLHNFLKKPQIHILEQKIAARIEPAGPGRPPRVTFPGNPPFHALAPADYGTIYNIPPFSIPANPAPGYGVTIAVVGRSNIFNGNQDITNFNNVFGSGALAPSIILDGPDPGDLGGGEEAEATLDITWSGAIAPYSRVNFVVSASTNTTDGVDLSEIYIVDNALGDVMTESFGSCEAGASDAAGISAVAEQAAAEGITYIVSTGDSGAEGCDDPNSETVAAGPVSVNVLASTAFNVAVGGTMFNEGGLDSKFWNSSNAEGTLESALSYIPENVWNESCASAQCGQNANILAGGGGASTLVGKPSWQSGVQGIPSDGARDIPDVSLTAAGHDPYLLCLEGSCVPDSQGNIFFQGVSGTSASAPSFAGIMALVDQKNSSPNFPYERQGQASYILYRLAAAENYSQCNSSGPASACVFNDITVGNNAVPGEVGYGTSTARYQSGPGFDLATGLGSVNVTNLVNNWSSVTFSPTTTTLSVGPQTIIHGSPFAVNITVAPKSGGGTPTGDVELFADFPGGSAVTVGSFHLAGGAVSSSTNLLPGGHFFLSAGYNGDKIYAPSVSAGSSSFVTVNPEPSSTTLTIASGFNQNGNPIPFMGGAYGRFVYLRADVSGKSGQGTATGTVNFLDAAGLIPGNPYPLNSQANSATPNGIFTLSAGSHSITAQYSGDPSFNSSNSTSQSFTITRASSTTAVSTTSATQGTTLNATVNTNSGGNPPSGTIQFSVNGTSVGGPVPVTGVPATFLGEAFSGAQATAAYNDVQLTGSQFTVVAAYSGDPNYATSTSPQVTVLPDFSITSSLNVIEISVPGGQGSLVLTVGTVDGFTGTVTFACSGLPSEAICSAPSVAAPGSSTLTITTKAPASVAAQNRNRSKFQFVAMALGVPFAGIILLGLPAKRRRFGTLLSLLAAGILMVGIGCGGGSTNSPPPPPPDPGTPVGTYTVTVTATSGTLTHNTTFKLIVQ
ncbi:MAG: protease pro-enzyme activation domain-containing protein [Terriglobales bacterium]